MVALISTIRERGRQLAEKWLRVLVQYLAENEGELGRNEIEGLPIVPDQFCRLHSPYYKTTPLLRPKSESLLRALERLPLPLVSGPPDLLTALENFARIHPDPGIWPTDGRDLLDTLSAWRHEWRGARTQFDQQIQAPILDSLSDLRGREHLEEDRLEDFLTEVRDTPLFPTDGGSVLPANAPDFYRPAGEQPPPTVSGRIHLANLGPYERWRELLEWAQVPPLNLPNVICSVLLPVFGDQQPTTQIDILRYIRDNLSRALAQEAEEHANKQLER